MKVPKELLLIFVILMVVAVATQQLAGDQEQKTQPDLISDSAAPGGARALYLWLESLGYRVERLEYRTFRPDAGTKVLFVLAPATQLDKDDLDALESWVKNGGVLIAAGSARVSLPERLISQRTTSNDGLDGMLKRFELALKALSEPEAEARPSQPLLLHPAVASARVEANGYVSGTANLIPYLGRTQQPVAAGRSVGKGQVYVLASDYAFSNQGLGQADNGSLLLNWLPAPSEAGVVAFDEIHHGRAEVRSLAYLVVHEPWGWAVLYALGMVFLYLIVEGRRFGRSVPGVVDRRRAAAEYVVSLAGLLRRGRKVDWVARHYEGALRRQLAVACGLDPALGTAAVADRVSGAGRLAGDIEGQYAGRVLLELNQGAERGIPEARLVRLAAETDRIIKTCSGRRQ